MIAEIISIGDELLIGQVINTNASWIAERLNSIGIRVKQISAVSDSKEHIIKSIDEATERADMIIMTGGLGPTKDDITKTTLCEYFHTSMVFNEDAYNNIVKIFTKRGFEITELNRKQAEIPANCKPISNSTGTAPGMMFKKEGKIFISMPGVPFEMKEMMTTYILPELQNLVKDLVIVHKTILTQGVGESFLSEKISDWENKLPENIKLAYLPSPGIVRLRLSAYGPLSNVQGEKIKITNKLNEKIEELIKELNKIIAEYIYGYDNDKLEEIIGRLLKEKGKTLSTAESCTGGNVAHMITSISGSSEYFMGSVIAYSNKIKENILGVNVGTLKESGAVSEATVKEMAEGIRKKFGTDYSIAITGIAGPDGGTEEKPVGTTWIAIATETKIKARKFLFGDSRERNITRASITALNMLRKEIVN
jgi:nicotinamide-nucleotide amidase